MERKILLSGDRDDFTVVAFDTDKQTLRVIANHPAPANASWIEPESEYGGVARFVGLSEGKADGLLYTFEIDHAKNTCKITSQQPTLGNPAHFITLRDGSALALGTYSGGSIALYPISSSKEAGLLLSDVPRTEVMPPFPYQATGHGPVKSRQQQCHVHQMLEDGRGLLYAPDLGADRVWILSRRGSTDLQVCGWLQCPSGTGARHAVLTPNEKIMYVLGELSHTVVAFDLSSSPAEDMQPIDGFAPSIIPHSVHPDHQSLMDSSELCLHPNIPNVLYASNRWERHIATREPHLQNVPKELPSGDALAIILLSDDGRKVTNIKHVRTDLDTIRGMRISDDGRYAAVVGQEGGGVEVYSIGGERGDEWARVANLRDGGDVQSGIKHAIWI